MRTCRALTLSVVAFALALGWGAAAAQDTPKPAEPKPVTDGRRHDPNLLASLLWLARHQDKDGAFNLVEYVRHCKAERCAPVMGFEEYNVGITGLAILAFLKAGYAPDCEDTYEGIRFGDSIRRALDWLIMQQGMDGLLASRDATKPVYVHAAATAAMCEAFRAGATDLEGPAKRAVQWLHDAQNPGKVWRYTSRAKENDSSATGWAMIALRVAKETKLGHSEEAWASVRAWFNEVTDPKTNKVGYNQRNTGKVFIKGKNDDFDHHETLAAIGASFRMGAGEKKTSLPVVAAGEMLLKDLPAWRENAIDYYYWHHGTTFWLQYEGKSGKSAKEWLKALTAALNKNQRDDKAGCARGSWDAVDRWACEGGRMYSTALNALTLSQIVPPAKPKPKPPPPAPPK